jgi:hypothetical protein
VSTKLAITTSHPICAHLILQQLPITVNDAADTAFRHKKLKYDMPIPRTLEKASTTTVHWFDWTKSYLWVVRGIRARSLRSARLGANVGELWHYKRKCTNVGNVRSSA